MKKFKDFMCAIGLTLIFSYVILWAASRVLIPKWLDAENNRAAYIIKGFYREPKNSLDVLFTGNSDVFRGVSPMEIYDAKGIKSYNFVSPGQRIWIAYPMLEEALRYQKPKVVFFNVDEVYFTSQTFGNAHKAYDNMKFGWPKIKGILDPSYKHWGKLSHFLPIFIYHDRYKELTGEDFKYAFGDYDDYLRGMDLIANSKPYVASEDYMASSQETAVIPKSNLTYLDKMRVLCEKRGIEFVLFEVPSPDSWNYKKHNALEEYANKYGLKFLDLNLHLDELNIDWNTDTADGGDHLNVFGAEKVSRYLADYIEENFAIEAKRNERWDEHYEEYRKFKENAINGIQS